MRARSVERCQRERKGGKDRGRPEKEERKTAGEKESLAR